eukprot:TRINITY_DN3118_c0_g1_i1.p1 TRINITY_DN3118_c0_g1~~TRINITY_DN3118_c0_g1_i1.p1  ORF type:complete len:358 (-),score=56.48 TRINITY_DN3118_c0_g1_i1:53-1126(-)
MMLSLVGSRLTRSLMASRCFANEALLNQSYKTEDNTNSQPRSQKAPTCRQLVKSIFFTVTQPASKNNTYKLRKLCDTLANRKYEYINLGLLHKMTSLLSAAHMDHPELWKAFGDSFAKLKYKNDFKINSYITTAYYIEKSPMVDKKAKEYARSIWKFIPLDKLKALNYKHFAYLCYLTQMAECDEKYKKKIIKEIQRRPFTISFCSAALNPQAPENNVIRVELTSTLGKYLVKCVFVNNPVLEADLKLKAIGILMNKVYLIKYELLNLLNNLAVAYMKTLNATDPKAVFDFAEFIIARRGLPNYHLLIVALKKCRKIENFSVFPKEKASDFLITVESELSVEYPCTCLLYTSPSPRD